jgi:hypothetical protein
MSQGGFITYAKLLVSTGTAPQDKGACPHGRDGAPSPKGPGTDIPERDEFISGQAGKRPAMATVKREDDVEATSRSALKRAGARTGREPGTGAGA